MKRYDEIGPKKAAEQLGVSYYTLQDGENKEPCTVTECLSGVDVHMHRPTAREIELEREISELRRTNEILKDALGFFAKDRKR